SDLEIAKSSGKHALRDGSEMPAQLPVSIRPLFQRKQNLGCPPADEDRRDHFRWLHHVHTTMPPAKPVRQPFEFASHVFFRARHRLTLPVLAGRPQLGTPVYLTLLWSARKNWQGE